MAAAWPAQTSRAHRIATSPSPPWAALACRVRLALPVPVAWILDPPSALQHTIDASITPITFTYPGRVADPSCPTGYVMHSWALLLARVAPVCRLALAQGVDGADPVQVAREKVTAWAFNAAICPSPSSEARARDV